MTKVELRRERCRVLTDYFSRDTSGISRTAAIDGSKLQVSIKVARAQEMAYS